MVTRIQILFLFQGSNRESFLVKIINPMGEGEPMGKAKSGGSETPALHFAGIALFLSSSMLWLYRHDLIRINYIIGTILMFRAAEYGISKSSLFAENESTLESSSLLRRAKIYSTLVALSLMFILVSATLFLQFSQQVGGDPEPYDSENYYDGSFHNREELDAGDGFTLQTAVDYLIDDGSRAPSSVLPSIEFTPMNITGEELGITWFGHSSILLQTKNITLLFDPVFGEDNTDPLFFGPSPFDYEHDYQLQDLPHIDYVFISHDHYDHLDMGTVKFLNTSEYIVPLGVKAHLIEWGIPKSNIQEFDWYQEANISEEMSVVFTPSQHFSGRGLSPDNTLWGSWAVYINQHRLYFSGDGGYSSEFSKIGEAYGPFDIAFIEAGQYDEAWADVHMFPNQTVQAAIDLKAATLLPIHNTKFVLALHGWDEPLEEVTLEGQRRNVSVTTPMIGESFVLGQAMPNELWWRNVSVYEPPFLKESSFIGTAMYTSMIAALVMIRLDSSNGKKRIELTYED
tara:strand:+ start:6894 stop:8432 length:1539 start_codon:yes stop_codon:yes gene_type:complete